MTKQEAIMQIRDAIVSGTLKDAEKALDRYTDGVVLAFHLWDSQQFWGKEPPPTIIESYREFKKQNK